MQDLAYYGLGLNNSLVLGAIGYSNGGDLFTKLYNNAVGMIILSVAGSLPGYWMAIFTIDTVGRKPLQIFGFLILTIIFCILGFAYHRLSSASLLALYIAAQFFFDFGPNTTTFIVPGECFPTRYRATGHGISAAAGKTGAIIAQVISIPILTKDSPPDCAGTGCSPWLGTLMKIFALFMLCGTVVSLLIPETKGQTLEELAGEPPTSYNAGRNGSISIDVASRRGRRRALNPFLGGKPAGFAYPRAQGTWTNMRTRRGDTLPVAGGSGGGGSGGSGDTGMSRAEGEQTGKLAPARTKGWWRRRRYGHQPDTNSSGDYGLSSSSSSTRAFNESTDSGRPGVVPGWNAGWGRIDRGAAPNTIHLQDVGRLIE